MTSSAEGSDPSRRFPPALVALAEVGDCWPNVDFRPYTGLLSAAETTEWLRDWTGNPEADGDAFRVFGQDGTGGLLAFWLVRPAADLTAQPVVYLGSEGETAVVAPDLGAFLWLLARGFDGHWAYCRSTGQEGKAEPGEPHPGLRAVAERHAPGPPGEPREVVTAAGAEFPGLNELMDSLSR